MSDFALEKDSHLSVVSASTEKSKKALAAQERAQTWKKGQSGNPSGRPKLSEEEKAEKFDLIQACRAHAPSALKVFIDLMSNAKQDSVKLQAAQALMERAYGKAVQPTDNINRTPADLAEMTAEEAYKAMLGERKAA